MGVYGKFLAHHGVLGQKWGVRRFQNKDGSLTPEGRKRLEKAYKGSAWERSDKEYYKYQDMSREKYGLDKNIIKKGTEIHRIANEKEPIDKKEKYVSITDNDYHSYREMQDMLGIDYNKPWGNYTYIAKHDLKIANADEVMNHVLEKYGDVKLKNLVKTNEEFSGGGFGNPSYKYKKEYKDKDHVEIDDERDYMGHVHGEVTTKIHEIMTTNTSEVSKYFKEKGYDGLVDIEDFNTVAEYPVILTTPVDSIQLKEYKELFGGW
jgi:hypothetical protein